MCKIFVCGLINIETTVKIENFPIPYSPVEYQFHGIHTSVSGVGYNIAKALTILGDNPAFFAITGNDIYNDIITNEMIQNGIETSNILPLLDHTAQSVILYDGNNRKIILDLKNIQETNYPVESIHKILNDIEIGVICNINFSRNFLKLFREHDKLIATDVHAIYDIDDNYNNDYIRYSDILFLSNAYIMGTEHNIITQLSQKYNHTIIVVSMGENGLLMYTREHNETRHFPAVTTRDVVNTTGAGDALFACFIHFYHKTKDPYYAIQLAAIFASYKIGEDGGSNGFLSEEKLIKMSMTI
jgi:ribokinase